MSSSSSRKSSRWAVLGIEGRVDLDLTLVCELDGVDTQGSAGDVVGELLLTAGVVGKNGLGGAD